MADEETRKSEEEKEPAPPKGRFYAVEILKNGFRVAQDDTASFAELYGLLIWLKEEADKMKGKG